MVDERHPVWCRHHARAPRAHCWALPAAQRGHESSPHVWPPGPNSGVADVRGATLVHAALGERVRAFIYSSVLWHVHTHPPALVTYAQWCPIDANVASDPTICHPNMCLTVYIPSELIRMFAYLPQTSGSQLSYVQHPCVHIGGGTMYIRLIYISCIPRLPAHTAQHPVSCGNTLCGAYSPPPSCGIAAPFHNQTTVRSDPKTCHARRLYRTSGTRPVGASAGCLQGVRCMPGCHQP